MAEDAMQEALVSGYRAFGSFRGDNLRSWLLRIVANTCRDMLRARKARPSVSLDFSPPNPESPDAPTIDSPSTDESPEEYALRRELGNVIQQGLQSLSQERRMAITLVDVQGLSYEEAAEVMGSSTGTLKSRLSRGRGDLRDFLRQHGELLPDQFRQGR